MKVFENCYIFRGYEGIRLLPYDKNGVLITDAIRLPKHNLNEYWSKYHSEDFLKSKIDLDEVQIKEEYKCRFDYKFIDECVFIGGVTNHIGHFILEPLALLAKANLMPNNTPIMYYLGDAVLPEDVLPCPKEEIKTVVDSINLNQLNIPKKGQFFHVSKLYVLDKPWVLSHSCPEPWVFKNTLEKIVNKAVDLYPMVTIEQLYLKRFGEKEINKDYTYSNPNEPLLKQISRIYHAKKLIGQVGSNTHMCVFAKYDTETLWLKRDGTNSGHYEESYRNQAICDLIKTYNKF